VGNETVMKTNHIAVSLNYVTNKRIPYHKEKNIFILWYSFFWLEIYLHLICWALTFITVIKVKCCIFNCCKIAGILIKRCRLIDRCVWQTAAKAVRVWLKCDVDRIREDVSNEITIQPNDKRYGGLRESRQPVECTYNVTLRRSCATIVAVEKQ
jgi:hypothetical protein